MTPSQKTEAPPCATTSRPDYPKLRANYSTPPTEIAMAMTGSQSHRGHRHREDHGGHYWRKGEPYLPLTVEMIASDAWRSLTPLGQNILLDMLRHYWILSTGDIEPLKTGFYFTFSSCRVDCSHTSFRCAVQEIVVRGWFLKVSGKRIVSRYLPGRSQWREYQDPSLPPLRPELKRQPRIKKKKSGSKKPVSCLGHFWRVGQAFYPISYSLPTYDAWRVLCPVARCIVLDMIANYNKVTYSDNRHVVGIAYGVDDCGVACSENSFYAARRAIVKAGWFTTPHEIQKGDRTYSFAPGPWKEYIAPADAKFRKTAEAKVKYTERQKARQLKKPTPKNWSVQPPKNGVYTVSQDTTPTAKIGVIGEQNMNERTTKKWSEYRIYHVPTAKRLKPDTIRRLLPISSSYCPLCSWSVGKIAESFPENGASNTNQLKQRLIS